MGISYIKHSLVAISILILLAASAFAQNPSHPASQITGGIFPNGMYTFTGSTNDGLVVQNSVSDAYVRLDSTAASQAYTIFTDATDSKFKFYDHTAGQVRMTMDTVGRLGVNTEFPLTTVDINGVVRANTARLTTVTNCDGFMETDGNGDITCTDGTITVPGTVVTLNDDMTVNGDVAALAFLYLSDRRAKYQLQPFTGALDLVKAIDVHNFRWTETGAADVGVIAQQVETVVPHVVSENEGGEKHVDYARLVPILISAIQEQQAQIEELQAQLE